MVKTFGDFEFDDRRRRLSARGQPVRLSGQRYDKFVPAQGLRTSPKPHARYDAALSMADEVPKERNYQTEIATLTDHGVG